MFLITHACPSPVYAQKKLVNVQHFAHVRACLHEGYSYLLGIARAIEDFCIQNTEFLVAGTCQMSHFG